jgi:serine protease inhibitor ecotin
MQAMGTLHHWLLPRQTSHSAQASSKSQPADRRQPLAQHNRGSKAQVALVKPQLLLQGFEIALQPWRDL